MNRLQRVLKKVHQNARETLKAVQLRQKKDYDVKLFRQVYEAGDLVYLVDSSTKIGQSSKLKSVWKGPYLITKVLSSILFQVQGRRRSQVVHHDRLKPCKDRAIPLWMRRMRHHWLDTGEIVITPDEVELNLNVLFQPTADLDDESDEDNTDDDTVVNVDNSVDNNAVNTNVTGVTTRGGRQIRRPGHLSDYVN